MVIQIPLSKTGKNAGKFAIIDDCDADLAKRNWCLNQRRKLNGYAQSYTPRPNRKLIQMHRVILERMLGRELLSIEFVDHINGDSLDNRRGNLRLANYIQNNQNSRTPITNKTGFKGVSYQKSTRKFRADIRSNRKNVYLGLFDTPELAHQAYCDAAKLLHGDFANFGEMEKGA